VRDLIRGYRLETHTPQKEATECKLHPGLIVEGPLLARLPPDAPHQRSAREPQFGTGRNRPRPDVRMRRNWRSFHLALRVRLGIVLACLPAALWSTLEFLRGIAWTGDSCARLGGLS
jgi:hypothetical protein